MDDFDKEATQDSNSEKDRKISSLQLQLEELRNLLKQIHKGLLNLNSDDSRIKLQIQKIEKELKDLGKSGLFETIERIHPNFFDQLLSRCDSLSQNELRHCAYIKMNLSKKEVAKIAGINHRSVEMAHYRIKRKLELPSNLSLSKFIHSLGQQRGYTN